MTISALVDWRLKSATEMLTPQEKQTLEKFFYPKNQLYTIIAVILVVLVVAAMINAGSPFGSPTGFYFPISALIMIYAWGIWRRLVKVKRSEPNGSYIRQYIVGIWLKSYLLCDTSCDCIDSNSLFIIHNPVLKNPLSRFRWLTV